MQPVVAVRSAAPQDAAKAVPQAFQIEFYELAVSQGTISANDDFWKPFDETFLGLWKHEILNKNGLRVGRAPLVELSFLRDELESAEQKQRSLIGAEGKDVEIDVRRNVHRQTLFFSNRHGEYEGRDYERCDNLFAASFRQTPRKPDHVRISLAPMVRAQRQRMEVANLSTFEVRVFQPQTLYDLGVELDLGVDECLVLSPTQAALDNQTLVGRIFMMEDRPAQRVEKILVVIPRLRGPLVETTPGIARQ